MNPHLFHPIQDQSGALVFFCGRSHNTACKGKNSVFFVEKDQVHMAGEQGKQGCAQLPGAEEEGQVALL